MKHPPFYVIKILQDTDLSHTRRIELAIDVLKLSKEELQQLQHDLCSPVTEINGCKLIDEILGVNENSRKVESGGAR